ncbi:MAG: radical SAM protein [Myxococcales bacterium]|nr:radical SAM protein [Myxococcales bacterium]
MKRPVWLLSLDSDQFLAPPTTTAGLKAYFQVHGRSADATDIELVHFRAAEDVGRWLTGAWDNEHRLRAEQARLRGLSPVVGLSMYTWNAAEFLAAAAHLRRSCPDLTLIAGGPHVQRAFDYVGVEPIDVVVLGEGEATFSEWLDASHDGGPGALAAVAGLAFLGADGAPVQTAERPRFTDLDLLPSFLDALELRDAEGRPKYQSVAYETTRGCPFRCAFCEWGTGAIGTKMYQHGLERIGSDFERLVAGGIKDIWLSDSNFGALPEDLDKARLVVELRKRTGQPSTLATSWSKSHNSRVREIVMLLEQNGLLTHYNLALQTLTPLALKLSNRRNMRSNRYEPIAQEMAEAGIPIATELIWGLPGDTLAEFERNLDRLESVFPNINIFGYTLLPGTEFYDRREEYAIETIPVAGYGKAKGEYVIGCHTFSRDEGMEGYFLISAHILLIRGHVMPRTARLLSLDGRVPVSALLRSVLRALVEDLLDVVDDLDAGDRMAIYARRAELYLAMLARLERSFGVIAGCVEAWLAEHDADPELRQQVRKVLALDEAFCPRVGPSHVLEQSFDFDAEAVEAELGRMRLPEPESFISARADLRIDHPAHVGEVLIDPDGGSWMRGRLLRPQARPDAAE